MIESWGMTFFICNGFIAVFILILMIIKRILHNYISNQIQYKIWYLLFALLTVPFLPFRMFNPISTFIINTFFHNGLNKAAETSSPAASTPSISTNLKYDFSISVHGNTQVQIGYILFYVWLIGVVIMVLFSAISYQRLKNIKYSALPLQNQKVNNIYQLCKEELNIKANIPIYSTAFLKSPVLIGFIHPKIYIPIHLVTDFSKKDLRFILLHELQHYKRKDIIGNLLMNLFHSLYWFNPFIWYAFKEIKSEREIACDDSVLHGLKEKEYIEYGYTLVYFAEKISNMPFLFFTSIGGNTKQIKKRIIKITSFQPNSKQRIIKGYSIFLILSIFVLEYSTFFPASAQEKNLSASINAKTAFEDLSTFFEGVNGSFVLYQSKTDSWTIYNKELALKRVSPNSTYKIYSALFSLEREIITPVETNIKWDGQPYPISQWNKNQTLSTAMQYSTNWYFQTLDKRLGIQALNKFYKRIEYGNCDLSGGLTEYWLESSLKISPFEQVQLLKNLYHNEFSFQSKNIKAVKNAIKLSSSGNDSLYGKTGTGKVNNQNVNGWFIGFVESEDNTSIFAVNIQNETDADGIKASQIALDILKSKNIYTFN